MIMGYILDEDTQEYVYTDVAGNKIRLGDVVAWPASYNSMAFGLVETLSPGCFRVWPLWHGPDQAKTFVPKKGMRRQKLWKLGSTLKVVKENAS